MHVHVHVYVQKSFYTCVYTPMCAGRIPAHLYVQEVFLHMYTCKQCSYTCICAGSIPEHIYWQEGFLHMMCWKVFYSKYMYICAGSIPAHMYWQEVFLYICIGRKYSCTSICAGSVPTHVYVQKVFLNIIIGRKNSCTLCAGYFPATCMYMYKYMCRNCSCTRIGAGRVPAHVHVLELFLHMYVCRKWCKFLLMHMCTKYYSLDI